jgi:hypothetical protein
MDKECWPGFVWTDEMVQKGRLNCKEGGFEMKQKPSDHWLIVARFNDPMARWQTDSFLHCINGPVYQFCFMAPQWIALKSSLNVASV